MTRELTMLEKVAAAIYEAMDLTDGLDTTAAETYARAAIEAMREPDDEMVEAACQATFIPVSLTGEQTHRLGYRAMLDAALALPIPGEENTEGEKR